LDFLKITASSYGKELVNNELEYAMVIFVSFVVLINESPSGFFNASARLGQGYSLSTFLFLLVVGGLNMLIKEVRRKGELKGIQVANSVNISHFLFVDDIMIFGHGFVKEIEKLE
jgi:hypothetical protein